MHSTGYILRFVLIMTTVVALVLALMSTSLKPIHDKNEAIYNKRAIISAIQNKLEKPVAQMSDSEVQAVFDNNITQKVMDVEGNFLDEAAVMARGYKAGQAENIDMAKERKKDEEDRLYPIYQYKAGDDQFSILSVRGSGLWDAIWGNIALDSDMNTIVGASFDHQGETPGLGAEIKDNPNYPAAFTGKKIFNEKGEYVSITSRKGGAKDPMHDVDGITGATVTADGVTDMMKDGMKKYLPYLKKK